MTRKPRRVALMLDLRWPYKRHTEWDGGGKGAELYDHTADPGEWVNLADRPGMAKTRGELSALVKRTETGAT